MNDILNEIDQQEQNSRQQRESNATKLSVNIDWVKIVGEMQIEVTNFIKKVITSRSPDINLQVPENGLTLLHYAIIIGSSDLVKVLVN